MSPIYSPPREQINNIVGLNLQNIRTQINFCVNTLISQGDTNLHYVDGLEIFGSEYENFLPDNLHPDAKGYKILG